MLLFWNCVTLPSHCDKKTKQSLIFWLKYFLEWSLFSSCACTMQSLNYHNWQFAWCPLAVSSWWIVICRWVWLFILSVSGFSTTRSLRPWQTWTHCGGYIAADTNVSPFARACNICCGHKFCVRDTKMFLILFRNILCPQQMLLSLRSPRNIVGNNVSATMCPRLPGPLDWLWL